MEEAGRLQLMGRPSACFPTVEKLWWPVAVPVLVERQQWQAVELLQEQEAAAETAVAVAAVVGWELVLQGLNLWAALAVLQLVPEPPTEQVGTFSA